MRTPEQLLASMRENKAKRLRFLEMQEKSQLINLIERLGHFDLINDDIAWLEKHVAKKGA